MQRPLDEEAIEAAVIRALGEIGDANIVQRLRAEKFFFGQSPGEVSYAKILSRISVNEHVDQRVRRTAAIVLVSMLKEVELSGEELEFFSQNLMKIVAASCSLLENKVLNEMSSLMFRKLMASGSAQAVAEQVVRAEALLAGAASVNAVTYLVRLYTSLLKALGAANLAAFEKGQVVSRVLLIADRVLKSVGPLTADQPPGQVLELVQALAKLLAVVARCFAETFMSDFPRMALWTEFCLTALDSDREVQRAAKSVLSTLCAVFERSVEVAANPADASLRGPLERWMQTYAARVIHVVCGMVVSRGLFHSPSFEQTFSKIARCFCAFLKLTTFSEPESRAILDFADHYLLSLCRIRHPLRSSAAQSAQELIEQNNTLESEPSVRNSAISMIVQISTSFIFRPLLEILERHLIVNSLALQDAIQQEALYAILEKASCSFDSQTLSGDAVSRILQSHILSDMSNGFIFLKFRAIVVAFRLMHPELRNNPQLLDNMTLLVRNNMAHEDLTVREKSVQLFHRLLEFRHIVEFVRPRADFFILVFLRNIAEFCKTEYIESLSEIFDNFRAELEPTLPAIFACLAELMRAVKVSPYIPDAQRESCLKLLLVSVSSVLGRDMGVLTLQHISRHLNVIVFEAIESAEPQAIEYALSLLCQLIHLHPSIECGNSLWEFFQFCCCFFFPPNSFSENRSKTLALLKKQRIKAALESYVLLIIELIDNFVTKFSPTLVAKDENNQFSENVLRSLEYSAVKCLGSSHHQEVKFRMILLVTSILIKYRNTNLETSCLKNMAIISGKKQMEFQSDRTVEFKVKEDMYFSFLGAAMYWNFDFAIKYIKEEELKNMLLEKWLKTHRLMSLLKFKKRSYIGLLTILMQSRAKPMILSGTITQRSLMRYLLIDLVYMEEQNKINNQEEDSDDDDDDDDEDLKPSDDLFGLNLTRSSVTQFLTKIKNDISTQMERFQNISDYSKDVLDEISLSSLFAHAKEAFPEIFREIFNEIHQPFRQEIGNIICQ